MSVIEAVLLGAGSRGYDAYGRQALAHPDRIRFVAVAEPNRERLARFASAHGIPPARQFLSWDELLSRPRMGQVLFNCTLDAMHAASTVRALELGYQVLLEKPMADTLEGCLAIEQAARRTGTMVEVAHVLRYTEFYAAVHRIVESGELGQVICARQTENVAHWHMAHSFVRGNWRRGVPMILAKCCHDLDLLQWNLGPASRIASHGSLVHFSSRRAPPGATRRCTDGCPVEPRCPHSALRIYLSQHTGWPVNVISEDLSLEARRRALQSGPYGRCVFHCDNDVVDNQVVTMDLARGGTATLVMQGHAPHDERTLRYDGTHATLSGRFFKAGGSTIEIQDHLTGVVRVIEPAYGDDLHGGGDTGLMQAFTTAVRQGRGSQNSVRQALESHLMAFAAEEARLTGTQVDLDPYRRMAGAKTHEPGDG